MARQPEIPQEAAILFGRVGDGDRLATQELFPIVYEELRCLAGQYLERESPPHTLQATALLNEAYLRLVGSGDTSWENRRHFFGAAAKAIRRILTDHARAKRRLKRGSGGRPVPLEDVVAVKGIDFDLVDLDEALARLANLDARKADLVELRFFGGMSMDEICQTLSVSPSTAAREWRFVRAWLHRELADGWQG
jgi:RNA polymerase sigma factor (TIGR02999 family)